MDTGKKTIAILGAGFGGLKCALTIGRKLHNLNLADKYRVILVDRNAYHTYTPTLYEAATTSKETASYLELKNIITFPITELIKNLPVDFINDKVTKLNLLGGSLTLADDPELQFDYLVLALGAETNYFNIPGLTENSSSFKTFMDAIKLRDKILNLYLGGKKDLKIVVGGAGSTGVELAGELQEWLCELEANFKKDCRFRVSIIGAQPEVLSGFLPRISELAEKRLRHLGVSVVAPAKIASATANNVILEGGRELPYDILIWTGGVKASSFLGTLPLKLDGGRIVVPGEMECLPETPNLQLFGKVYGIGDAVCFYNQETKKAMPMVARTAILQAKIVAHNIIEEIKLENKIIKVAKKKVFAPREYPYIIPVGGKYAIAKIGNFVFSGLPAWIFKGLVELNYLLSILPFSRAIKVWLRGLVIFIKNDRLG